MYLIRLAFRPWRIAMASQLFSTAAVAVLLMLAGILAGIDQGLKPIIKRMTHQQVLAIYVSESSDPVVDQVRVALGAAPEHLEVVPQSKLIGDIQSNYPELARELQAMGEEELAKTLPIHILAAGQFDAGVMERLKKVSGVEDVESSRDRQVESLSAFKTLRWSARLLFAGVLIALFTVIALLARLNSHLQNESRKLLELWGAGFFVARAPVLINGLWIGAAAGIASSVLWSTWGGWFVAQLEMLSPQLQGIEFPRLMISVGMPFAGIALGVLASLLSPRAESVG